MRGRPRVRRHRALRSRVVRAALALAALALAAGPACAQDATPPEDPAAAEARALFDRGRALAEERRFSEAVESFERSLELVERPSTVFNLALCHYALERYVEAVAALERFERVADPDADAESGPDARRTLAHARAAIARLVVEVEPADAAVTLDGAPIEGGATRERALNPGPHVLRVEAPHHATALLELDAARGEALRRAIALEPTRRPAALEVEVDGAPGAVIEVDGRAVGTGRAALDLDAGRHEVRAIPPGGAPIVEVVALDWNERVRLALLAPPPATSAAAEAALWAALGGTLGAAVVAVIVAVVATLPAPSPNGGSTYTVRGVGGGGVGMVPCARRPRARRRKRRASPRGRAWGVAS